MRVRLQSSTERRDDSVGGSGDRSNELDLGRGSGT